MKKNLLKSPAAGWVVAGAMALFMVSSGFQPVQEKTGVVDLNKVIQDSAFGQEQSGKLSAALTKRRELIDFITTYSVLTIEQANQLRELSVKDRQTEADLKAIEKIKKDVQDSDKKRNELMTKANLTEAERSQLAEYGNRVRQMEQVLNTWDREFSADLNEMRDKLQQETVTRAKDTLKEVAAKERFSTVLESTVAPYGANDLTDSTIKAMNAKR